MNIYGNIKTHIFKVGQVIATINSLPILHSAPLRCLPHDSAVNELDRSVGFLGDAEVVCHH